MLFNVVNALGELACVFPVQGSFTIYSSRFIHPSWGFAMGWNYALQWIATLPTELSAAVLVIQVCVYFVSVSVSFSFLACMHFDNFAY